MGLDREQKKIISLAAIALAVFIAFWRGCYVPQAKSTKELKAKVDLGKAEEESIYAMIDRKVASLDEAVGILKEEAERLGKKRIRQKDISSALRGLSDAARRAGVRIISTRPQSTDVFTNKTGATPSYEGLSCMKTPVAIKLEGDYGQIARYIELLENSPNGIYTIEGFLLKKQQEGSDELEADLLVFIYCFG